MAVDFEAPLDVVQPMKALDNLRIQEMADYLNTLPDNYLGNDHARTILAAKELCRIALTGWGPAVRMASAWLKDGDLNEDAVFEMKDKLDDLLSDAVSQVLT